MGLDVSGIGALKGQLQTTNEQLGTTNHLLEQVLAELKHMNEDRLGAVAAAIELLNTQVATLATVVGSRSTDIESPADASR